MSNTVIPVSSEADLLSTCGKHKGLTVVLIWAQWHDASVHIKKVFEALAKQQPAAQFASVNVDVCANLATKLGANQVPFTAFLSSSGDVLDSFGGPDPPKLMERVKTLSANPKKDFGKIGKGLELNARLEKIINVSPVMLFMKGTKDEPFCKFSKEAVAILNKQPVEYTTFNILEDEEVRQGLKEYKDWKTFPQIYINGELIGGVDILKEMDEDGSIGEMLPSSSNKRLKGLLEKAPVMVFMKGNPEGPKCGFSRKICETLKEEGVEFDTFDILSDEDVRQGLKAYANWSTYPQLYAQGKLVGGLDIIKELLEDGSLKREIGLIA